MAWSRSILFCLLASLWGCGEPAGQSADAPAQTPAPPTAGADRAPPTGPAVPSPAPVPSLEGGWRVAGIDGAPLDEPVGLALTGDGRRLWWEPRCAGVARAYNIYGDRIAFRPAQEPRPAGAPTPPVCAIGLPPRLGDVMRALDEATSVSRTASNGVLIAGPKHSVTLYSQ